MGYLRAADFRHLGQFLAQCLTHIGHLLEGIRLVVVDPFEHLLGTEFFLPHGQEELFHLRARKAEQIHLLLGSHSILQ